MNIIYEPFSYRLKGDHRGFYFDISEKVLFGKTQDPVYPAKSDAQLWNDILFTSGGRLEISKCGYHTIYFDFQSNGIPIMRRSTHQHLQLTDPNGNVIPVSPKNIYQPRRNLGHFKNPAGK